MAKGKAVDDPPFDPSAVAGDKPSKRRRRASKAADTASLPPPSEGGRPGGGMRGDEWPAGADPALDEDIAEDADAMAHPEEFETRPSDLVEAEWQLAKHCADFDQNDAGNGQRLIIWYGPNLAYVSGMGWLVFRGTHWQRDEGELEARRLCQLLVDKIKLEAHHIEATPAQAKVLHAAEQLKGKDESDLSAAQKGLIGRAEKIRTQLSQKRSKRRNFAVTSGNAGKTAAMLTQAASFKSIDQKLLDANHMLFNVKNGTLVFRRDRDPEQDIEGTDVVPRMIGIVEKRDHAREDMMTKLADVDYDPAASCPRWHGFLDRMMPDKDMQRFLQVFHAYAILIGGNGSQKVAYHYGKGGNGKSAFLETLGGLAGSYRVTIAPESITGEGAARQGQQANPDLARLHNARFVLGEELPKGVPLRENLVKAMSGGTPILARFLQKDFFEFVPIFTAVLSGNTKPAITGSDKGIWRRVLIIHWPVSIEDNDPTKMEFSDLLAWLSAERPGILNWLIEGALLYLRDGLAAHIPASVRSFTEEYRRDRDNVEMFAESMIIESQGQRIQAGHLYKRYEEWCAANAITAAKQRTFGDRLAELGYRKETGRVYEYLDIAVRAAPIMADDPGWEPDPSR